MCDLYDNKYEQAIEYLGEEYKDFTTLKPNLTGINPDDSYSDIPYEKGYNFMYFIESLIGEEIMEQFFKSYFINFQYKSIDFYQFKDYFLEFCKNNSVSDEILNEIDWNAWIFTPGDIPITIQEENINKIVNFIKNGFGAPESIFFTRGLWITYLIAKLSITMSAHRS